MIRYLCPIFFTSFVISGCVPSQPLRDITADAVVASTAELDFFNIKGDPGEGDYSCGSAFLTISEYGSDGNISKKHEYRLYDMSVNGYHDHDKGCYFDPSGDTTRRLAVRMEDGGMQLNITTWSAHDDGSVKRLYTYRPIRTLPNKTSEYIYTDGRLDTLRKRTPHGEPSAEVYSYDSSGKLRLITYLNKKGVEVGFESFDSLGRDSYYEYRYEYLDGKIELTRETTTFTGDSLDYNILTVGYRDGLKYVDLEVYENGLKTGSMSSQPEWGPEMRGTYFFYYDRFVWDEKGRLTTIYDIDGRLQSRREFTEDARGNWTRIRYYKGSGEPHNRASLRAVDYYTD